MLYRYFNNWYCSFFLTEKIPGGETPLRLPYRHWSETRENELSLVWNSVRIWRSRRHNPTVNSQEYPPSPGEKILCQLGLPWAAWSIYNYKSWSLIACLQSILCSQHPLRAYECPHRMLGRVYPDFGRVSASLSSVITKRKLTQTWPLYLRRLKLSGAKFLMSGHGIRI